MDSKQPAPSWYVRAPDASHACKGRYMHIAVVHRGKITLQQDYNFVSSLSLSVHSVALRCVCPPAICIPVPCLRPGVSLVVKTSQPLHVTRSCLVVSTVLGSTRTTRHSIPISGVLPLHSYLEKSSCP